MIRQFTLVAVVLISISCRVALGQNTGPGNRAWNVELGGLGQLISFNLEWVVRQKATGFWVVHAGVAKYQDGYGFGIPHSVTWNIGRQKNYFEIGLGGSLGPTTLGYADASTQIYYLAPIAGYRLHPSKGFQFRIYASPYLTTSGEVEVVGIVGISFGRVFNR